MKNITMTTPKADWTGEKIFVEIKFDRPGIWTFEVYDYGFTLVKVNTNAFVVRFSDEENGHPVVKGYLLDTGWIASSGADFESGIVREDANPFKAAVQVLCNII